MFLKVDNVRDFLFAFLEVEVFLKKRGLHLKERISCDDLNYIGGNNENDSSFP